MEGKATEVRSPVSHAFLAELISFAAYHSVNAGAFVDIDDFAGAPPARARINT